MGALSQGSFGMHTEDDVRGCHGCARHRGDRHAVVDTVEEVADGGGEEDGEDRVEAREPDGVLPVHVPLIEDELDLKTSRQVCQ